MPIYYYDSLIDKFNAFGTELQKIYFQDGYGKPDVLVWENWKLITDPLTVGTQPETGYDTVAEFIYTVPPTVKPKTIKCDAWVTNHVDDAPSGAGVHACIELKLKGTGWIGEVARGSGKNIAYRGVIHDYVTYEVPKEQQDQIEQIKFLSRGNSFKRGVTGILEQYYQKGSGGNIPEPPVPPKKYNVNVTYGTGSGQYESGKSVTVTANNRATEQLKFSEWTFTKGSVPYGFGLKNITNTFTMPSEDLSMTAQYIDDEPVPVQYNITAINGVATPTRAAAGTTINVRANTAPTNQVFDVWESTPPVSFNNAKSSNTTFSMIGSDVTVTANYRQKPVTKYRLTVDSGTGSGKYAAGVSVTAVANDKVNHNFQNWNIIEGTEPDNFPYNSKSAKFNMPANNLHIAPNYIEITPPPVEDEWELITTPMQVVPAASAPRGDGILESVGQKLDKPVRVKNFGFICRNSDSTQTDLSNRIKFIGISNGKEFVLYDSEKDAAAGNDVHMGIPLKVIHPELVNTEFDQFKMTMSKRSDLNIYIKEGSLSEYYVKKTTKPTKYKVNIMDNAGTGYGEYYAGDTVTITADTSQYNADFKEWSVIEGVKPDGFDLYSPTNTFTMPASNLTFKVITKTPTPGGSWQDGVGELLIISDASVPALAVTQKVEGKAPGYPFKVDTFKFKISTSEWGDYVGPRIIIYGIDGNSETVQLFDSMFDGTGLYNKEEYEHTVKASVKDIELYNIRVMIYGGDYYKNVTATVNYLKLSKWKEKK